MEPLCPQCHTVVRSSDYYCYNCGKALREAPPNITMDEQIKLYIGSLLLPPLGYIWGWRYVKSSDVATRRVGFIIWTITTFSLIVAMRWSINFINSINAQVQSQLQGIQGF